MKIATWIPTLALLAAALPFQACNTADSGEKCPGDTATVIVNLSLPAGVAGTVLLSGPKGYATALDAGDTLSGLAAGQYTVTYRRVKVAGSVVGKAYYARISEPAFTLAACQSKTLTVEYLQEPGSEHLFVVARNDSKINAYAAAAVAAGGAPAKAASLSTPSGPGGLAFDPWGNLWVCHSEGVSMFALADLVTPGAKPKVDLKGAARGAGSPGAVALAFAPDSALWIALGADDKVIRLARDQLLASGSPVPAVTLSGPDLDGPKALAFDADGNLWVGGVKAGGSEEALVRFDKARLGAAYAGAADAKIVHKTAAQHYRGIEDIAFDKDGNLLVAFAVSGFLVRVPKDRLAASADSLAPAVALSSVPAANLRALAIDEAGGAWTTSTDSFLRVAPASLGASGVLAGAVIVTGAGPGPVEDVALNPAPEALPLRD